MRYCSLNRAYLNKPSIIQEPQSFSPSNWGHGNNGGGYYNNLNVVSCNNCIEHIQSCNDCFSSIKWFFEQSQGGSESVSDSVGNTQTVENFCGGGTTSNYFFSNFVIIILVVLLIYTLLYKRQI